MKLKRYDELNEKGNQFDTENFQEPYGGRGSQHRDDIFSDTYSDDAEENQFTALSPEPYSETPKPWNKRTAFNRDLTQELTDVCDRFLRHIDPEDIEQALIELSYKYRDMK